MKEYKSAKKLFEDIVEIKKRIRLIYTDDQIREYKKFFYNQKINEKVLDWFWRFIWDEISYKELKKAMHL